MAGSVLGCLNVFGLIVDVGQFRRAETNRRVVLFKTELSSDPFTRSSDTRIAVRLFASENKIVRISRRQIRKGDSILSLPLSPIILFGSTAIILEKKAANSL